MNKTMIALMIASLAATMPVPTAQGIGEICTKDLSEAVLDQIDKNLKNSMYEAGACVVACDGLIGVETPDKVFCVDGPTVQLCEKPYVGIVLSGSSDLALCQEVDPLSTGSCPPGTVGTVINGRSLCVEDDVDPCAEVDCDIVPEIDMGRHHPCDADGYSEDDSGFGGTHATCYYACRAAEMLFIKVQAEDQDADVSGYTDCGDAYAECPRTPFVCNGHSTGFTKVADGDQGCVGDSHEFYSSRITVSCYAIGQSLACQLTGIDCPDLQSNSRLDLCAVNSLVPREVVMRLLEGIPSGATSFVSFEFQSDPEGILIGFVVNYDALTPQPSCWARPL
ncbi:MAG: hypothetical protein ACYC2H_04085 [Thermoplasmatota archaeon]